MIPSLALSLSSSQAGIKFNVTVNITITVTDTVAIIVVTVFTKFVNANVARYHNHFLFHSYSLDLVNITITFSPPITSMALSLRTLSTYEGEGDETVV